MSIRLTYTYIYKYLKLKLNIQLIKMEEMKNLIISALDTKGVLGQIRAHLRSAVFKAVDEQDQPFKTGCGYKWENPTLYKIIETRFGTLLAEILRDFMEYFRMDYSLSTFIPECGINPERLKKDEMLNKMGLFGSHEEYMLKRPMPLMYYIMYYFLEQVRKDPESVIKVIRSSDDFEKKAETILDENIATLAKNQEEDIPISGDRPPYEEDNKHMNYNDDKQGMMMNDYAGQGAMKNDVAMTGGSSSNNNMNKKRSYEYEERRGKLSLDNYDEDEEEDDLVSRMKMKQNVQMDIPLQKKEDNKIDDDDDDYVPEEINEEIVEDVSVEQSNDKKSGSQNTQTISMSLGNDGTVDSHALDQYTYIEAVEKK